MKPVLKFLVLMLVAFWALMTNHCGLENIPGLGFLACSPQAEPARHLPSNCGDSDACATVEFGLYKSEDSQVSAGSALWIAFALVEVLSDLAAVEPLASEVSPETTPPELAQAWQFSFRTALQPRAPSIAS